MSQHLLFHICVHMFMKIFNIHFENKFISDNYSIAIIIIDIQLCKGFRDGVVPGQHNNLIAIF